MRPLGWLLAVAASAVFCVSCTDVDKTEAARPAKEAVLNGPNWITWGGDLGNQRYAPLDQINATNADQLAVVWRRPGELIDERANSNWKATPLYVDGVLYVPTGGTQVAAIDPGTGETKWVFTPDPYRVESTRAFSGSSRAVSYWTDGTKKRLLLNSIDGRLISIDAETGKADASFGVNGQVDLKQELLLPDDPREVQDINSTAPGVVVGDVIVVQVIGDDTIGYKGGTPGYVRGYDVRTGKKLWTFHTIPRPGEFGNETWENDSWKDFGAASVWSMLAADPELGYVYLPVESATNNFWGGDKPGDGLFAESIVCLDAKTGERVWHYQILHHGVWDYDLPAGPILHDVVKDGKTIKAVSVLTKQGMNFVFDRVTGEPVWPIEERPVPTSMGVPGEKLSPTQPFPTRPAPYSNLGFHEEDVLDLTPELHAQASAVLERYTKGPMYTPPTLVSETNLGTIVYPNYGGGANWSGGAVDPETNTLFAPTRNTFMALGLTPVDSEETDWRYRAISGGVMRLENGLPINRPPWALVTATDMNKGDHIWSRSIGGAPDWVRELPELQGKGLDFDSMGQISVRPSPLITKSLMFIASSGNIGGDPGDNLFWAHDKITGEIVAKIELPAKTSGAPMTYMHEGRQYIVVALSERTHPAELIALALPRPGEATAAGSKAAQSAGEAETVAMGSAQKAGINATAAQLATGRQAYVQSCALCHGADGKGVPGGSAPALQELGSLDDIRNVITNGSAEMPPMNALLSAEQIDAVSRFVALGLPQATPQ